MLAPATQLERLVVEIIAPLVERDAGQLYIVQIQDELVSVHLTGRFSGCAGNELFANNVLLPLLRTIVPSVQVTVTSGPLIPDGARLGKASE